MPKVDFDALTGEETLVDTPSNLPQVLEAGLEITRMVTAAGASAWSTLFTRTVEIDDGELVYQTPAEALADVGDRAVISTLKLSGPRQGQIHLILPDLGARNLIAAFMALTTGDAPDLAATELDAEGMDACGEAINQMAGSAAQSLRQAIDQGLNLAAENTRVVDFEASPPAVEFGAQPCLHHRAQLAVADLEPVQMHLLCSVSITGMRIDATGAADGDAADRKDAAPAGSAARDEQNRRLALKMNVPVIVVLAEKKVRMEVIQTLAPGSIIEFRKLSGELLDLCVGKLKIAEGEVVITNEHFGIQVRRLVDIRAALMASQQ